MFRVMLAGKIHRATVTETHLDYEGSLTVDADLLEAAGMVAYEQIQVYNVSTGDRFETYLIEGPRHSGAIALNGAAARRGQPGDTLIIATYHLLPEEQVPPHRPRVVFVDEKNARLSSA
ncbi:MAG: aspartate 1-decarboxylase [candidate division NC10 bacterium]|nr:aspartate 1-decarboxylase [candidate division NC10 bacterium]MBI4839795.1 aspartate 1-decarboxylase [candidate division NC10 bacterium]